MKAVRVIIEGRVQGVYFRAWTEQTAQELDLTGWVRNRRDGSVEALFCGREEAVDRMLALCREGPPSALVTGVQVEAFSEEPPPPPFRVLPTA